MSEANFLYLLQNQNRLFLSKTREWVDATDLSILFRSPHRDEAVNQLVEVNAKDVEQRIRCVECEIGSNGQPLIDPAIVPEPLPKADSAVDPGADTNAAVKDSGSGEGDTTVHGADAPSTDVPSADVPSAEETREPQLALVD